MLADPAAIEQWDTSSPSSGSIKAENGLRVQGDQLMALVNGEEADSVRGAPRTGGDVLIGVGDATDGLADARFDNLLVTGLPALPAEGNVVEMMGDVR